jgi:alkylhydroperoxidase family enzyme
MSKQTAVEWLVEQILKEKGLVDLDIEKAKEMEKEQIIEAFKEGNLYHGWALKHEPEQYYNKTYKKDK